MRALGHQQPGTARIWPPYMGNRTNPRFPDSKVFMAESGRADGHGRAALRAKTGPGAVFLVTDAMATAGSDIDHFTLNGRRIQRRDGRLTLADGTLAGADLDFPRALRVMTQEVGVALDAALAMATAGPARVLRRPGGSGRMQPGGPADFVHLSTGLELLGVWAGGERVASRI